jgi:hypothetical protein
MSEAMIGLVPLPLTQYLSFSGVMKGSS